VKPASTALLAVAMAAACTFGAVASQSSAGQGLAQAGSPPAENFGAPPSGQIPILYNDHHVYSKPDVLKQGRVLSALVKNGTLLIPLRSMFEQMGATVSYDAGSKTATVTKPGSEVKVTVGKPEVMINGEARPLDVPPMIYQGNVLVPVRVISEGMGAYVLWVADKRLVVVRYIPPTPPPTPEPTMAPAPPTPTPTPMATPYRDLFVAGDYIISPKVYNEFSPGTTASNTAAGFSWRLHGAVEFDLFNLPWMVEGDYRQYNYQHPNGFVTNIGLTGATFVPSFNVRDYDLDARVGLRILQPRIYIGVGYLHREENYGYPKQNGFGFGAEKLPDLDQPLSVYGSVWYYPSISGNYTYPNDAGVPLALRNTTDKFQQRFLKYQIGGTLTLGNSGLFLDAGFLGDTIRGKNISPSDASHAGGYVGLGIKF